MNDYKVTQVTQEPIELLSASRMELGKDAARITWRNCLEAADRFGESLALDYDDARDHFRVHGAWEDSEIDAWSDHELQALVIQETAAELRELEAGGETSSVYTGDDGETWIYLGA